MRKRAPSVNRQVEAYGEHALQVGEWFTPLSGETVGTVVLIHGGFWQPRYDRHLEEHIAIDLATRGYLCWNIDYRSGAEGWPATLLDAAAAYDHLADSLVARRIDVGRLAVVGHSAGGHLAAWLGSRHRLPVGAPGYPADAPPPALMVPQAGVVALARAAMSKIGRGAPQALLGGSPDTQPERYRAADPAALAPTGVRSVLVHTRRDKVVPLALSQIYVDLATGAGDDSRLEACSGDHFSHLDPKSAAHRALLSALATMTA